MSTSLYMCTYVIRVRYNVLARITLLDKPRRSPQVCTSCYSLKKIHSILSFFTSKDASFLLKIIIIPRIAILDYLVLTDVFNIFVNSLLNPKSLML